MKEKLNKKLDKKDILNLLPFAFMILLIVGLLSYAYVNIDLQGIKISGITKPEISMSYEEKSNALDLTLTPMGDALGKSQSDYFEFTVSATGKANDSIDATIYIKELEKGIENTNIKAYLTKVDNKVETEVVPPTLISDFYELSSDTGAYALKTTKYSFVENQNTEYNDTYRLRVWAKEKPTITGGYTNKTEVDGSITSESNDIIYNFKVNLTTKEAIKNLDTSGANAPLLADNMIPVYFDEADNNWKKADVLNRDYKYKWYDYDTKMWANAVTVTSTNRSTYLNANAGSTIPMSDINTMFVWIPRYKYTYFESSTPVEIPITFESDKAKTGTISCSQATTATETCTDTTNGSIIKGTSTYTHPAFTFGNEELTGLWVGKFDDSATVVPTATSTDLRTVIIKPGVESWRYTAVSYFFQSIRNMELAGNVYGFSQTGTTLNTITGEITGDSNNLDTHMLKNIEWGAVAYLSHSKYGSATAIERNTTAYTGGGTGVTYAANKAQSTTKNIYGVYDVNGGANEFVMANSQNAFNNISFSSAGTWGASKKPLEKYYDRYAYGASKYIYAKSKLGDGIKEMDPDSTNGSWYGAFCDAPYSDNPWLVRGGTDTSAGITGLFYSATSTGGAGSFRGARSVLTILTTSDSSGSSDSSNGTGGSSGNI